MAKETYYFSHDYNARHDKKIAALVRDYKSSGYGIFWCACEMMHEGSGFIEMDDLTFGAIAKDLNEDESHIKEVLENCITKYRLFHKNEAALQANEAESKQVKLTSNRVKQNLSDRNDKKKAKSEAGRIGGINSGISRRTKQNEAVLEPTKQRKGNKRKGKEIKEIGIYPTQEFKIDLPDFEKAKAVEYITTTKQVQADSRLILSFWDTFKIKNFTGKKFYKNERDIFSHFFESLKFQQVNGRTQTHQPNSANSSGKLGTSEARTEALRNW